MFQINLDISELLKLDENLKPYLEDAAKQAATNLSAATYAHIKEKVNAGLKSRREKYLENLGIHQVSETTWLVDLTRGGMWIEDGLPPNFDMIDSLLDDSPKQGQGQPNQQKSSGTSKGKTHTAKDGSRYRVIPFQHNTGPAKQTQAQTSLTDTIKTEMKKMGAPYGKLEKDPSGKPALGLIRKFDIMNSPLKTTNSPGQGKGPIGSVQQGPTGIPLLQGVRVYQRKVQDSKGKESTKKYIMTFRIVSSKHKGQGRWMHPGLEGKKFFDEAFDWAMKEWEDKIAPEILESLIDRF